MEKVYNDDIAIVVTAFNRPKSIERLLGSLLNANYPDKCINLIISIDYSGHNEVLRVAENFQWIHGKKTIIAHKRNLGLRKHILSCGQLTEEYNNIILLEDDIFVARDFYNYALQALRFYRDDNRIAGISLYSQRFNETASLPFFPLKDDCDTYFMQLPSSWGQLWTKLQWKEFKKWYDLNSEFTIKMDSDLPFNIVRWPESSWKKYFMKYMVESNKYFVYPFQSLSTNFGDIGEHFWKNSTAFQVELSRELNKSYNFKTIEDSKSIYDIYCENLALANYINLVSSNELTVDLYGQKRNFRKYLLTTKAFPRYTLLDSFALDLKPLEANIINGLKGDKILLYDTTVTKRFSKLNQGRNLIHLMEYFYPGINIQKTIKFSLNYKVLRQLALGIIKKVKKKVF